MLFSSTTSYVRHWNLVSECGFSGFIQFIVINEWWIRIGFNYDNFIWSSAESSRTGPSMCALDTSKYGWRDTVHVSTETLHCWFCSLLVRSLNRCSNKFYSYRDAMQEHRLEISESLGTRLYRMSIYMYALAYAISITVQIHYRRFNC